MKNLRNTLLVMAAVAIVLAIVFNEFLVYTAIFVGAMVVFYALYSAFISSKDKEIEQLRNKLEQDDVLIEKVKNENEELRNRKFNMAAIREVLDLGLFEVDTNFTRTWNEEMMTDDGKVVQFIGALRVDIIAKYGIDLKDIRIKHQGDEVLISRLDLKSLSFTDLNYDWIIAEVLEHKKPYLGGTHRRTNTLLDLEATRIKERLQKRTHEEVKKGPEELNAVVKILEKQVMQSVSMVLGLQNKKLRFVSETDEGFTPIEQIGAIGT